MKKPAMSRGTGALGALLALAMGNGAVAQSVLEEVIVTAQKREQNLQDVPVAVTAFTGAALERSGVKDMYQLSSIAPSLSVSQEQTSTASTFAIRGIFTSSQNFGLESSVGLYVDGVYRARQGSMINNMVDVASVEVLRGPQGTLFGRNTPAGAVTLNSVAPDFENTGFLEAEGGKYNLRNFSGARSFTVMEDQMAMRLSGFWMERDGHVDLVGKEIQDKESLNDRDRWGGRFQTLFTPSDDLTLRLIMDYSEVDEVCCGTGAWKNNFVADNFPDKTGTDLIVATPVDEGGLGGTVIQGKDFYDRKVSASFKPESRNEDKGVSLQADWETDHFLLTSITAYREHNAVDTIDADFLDVDGLIRRNDANQDQISQELRISNSYDNFNYVGGLFFYRQELDSNSDTVAGFDADKLVGADIPGVPSALPGGTGSLNQAEQTHKSYAIFGQVDYNLTETIVLTGGLRWTFEDKDMKNTFTDSASSTPAPTEPGWGFWQFDPLAPRDDLDIKEDDDKITGTAKVSWFMNDMTMFYASYGTGYKSGGVNTDRIGEQISPEFDAEDSKSFELGMKADFPDQALRLNVALHRTDTDDLQTISFQGTGFVLENAGTAETYGAEVDLSWLPTDSTTITVAYAYNHAEYEDFERGPCWTGTTWHTGEQPGENADGTCDRSGGDVSGNAEHIGVVTANQDFNISANFSGFAYGEWIYTDDRMTDVNNDPVKRDGSYNLFNLRAGVTYEPWMTTLSVWGRNITDEDYTGTIADAVVQDGRINAYYNDPVTWGVNIRKDF